MTENGPSAAFTANWRDRLPSRATPFTMALRLALLLTAVVVALPILAMAVLAVAILIAAVVVFILLLLICMLITPIVFLFKGNGQAGEEDDGRRNVRVIPGDNAADET